MKNVFSIFLLAFLPAAPAFSQMLTSPQCSNPGPYRGGGGGPYHYNGLSFYLAAHQDDWQLFMGVNAQNDMLVFDRYHPDRAAGKVVFIYVTAGDEPSDDPNVGIVPCPNPDAVTGQPRTVPYWKVREAGALNSIYLGANKSSDGWAFEPDPIIDPAFDVNGHPMFRYEYKNTVSYFMRIAAPSFDAIVLPHNGSGPTIDNTSVYNGWCDIVKTIAAIYTFEESTVEPGVVPWINIPDYDQGRNPNDHQNHWDVGRAAIAAAHYNEECMNAALYVDYHSINLSPNVGIPEAQLESGLIAVYCLALIHYHFRSEWIMEQFGGNFFEYEEWAARNYFVAENTCDMRFYDDCPEHPHYRNMTEDPLKISPNPVSDAFTIDASAGAGITDCTILASDGREVYHGGKLDDSRRIDVTGWKNGFYLVLLTKADGSKRIQKIIVQHQEARN